MAADRGRLGRRPALVVRDEPRCPFAEGVNDVRTGIMLSNVDKPPQVVAITSSGPGEGKTTLTCNLASALSLRGRTLLLEADLRRGELINRIEDHLVNEMGFAAEQVHVTGMLVLYNNVLQSLYRC